MRTRRDNLPTTTEEPDAPVYGPPVSVHPIAWEDHYWLCAEKPRQVYSTRSGTWLPDSDAGYADWRGGGRLPSRIGTLAELGASLAFRGLAYT